MDLGPIRDTIAAVTASILAPDQAPAPGNNNVPAPVGQPFTGADVVWEDEPRPMTSDTTGTICLLRVVSVVPVGKEERIPVQDLTQPKGQEMTDQYRENRYIVVTFKVESHDQTAGLSSLDVLERIRTRMGWRSNRGLLLAAGVAWTNTELAVDLTATQDDHRVSIWALDFRFFARVAVMDPAAYPYVEAVRTPAGTITP